MPTDALDVVPSEQSVLHLAFNRISHRLYQSFGDNAFDLRNHEIKLHLEAQFRGEQARRPHR